MFKKRSGRSTAAVPRRRQPVEDDSVSGVPGPAGQFRRNQTLSSYRRDTSPEGSERQKAHHLTVQRRRLGGIFLLVAIAVVLLSLLLWQLVAQVHVTTSSKQLTTTFSSKPYEDAIQHYLALNPAQRLRVVLDQRALSSYLAAQLPEVEGVSLTNAPGIAQAAFTITFRTPIAGWQINNKQYYVDANGVVFEKNYYQAPTVQIVDESGISPEQGSAVVGTRLLGFLGKVVSLAGERGYTVTKAVLPQGATREVDIYLDGVAPRVKLLIDRGAGEQVEDMDRSLKYLQAQGIKPAYVDVRVSGRAAYK